MYNPEHALLATPALEVILLNGAQRLCGGGVAGKDDQFAPTAEEFFNRLKRVAIDNLERVGTIGRTCVIAQVEVVVLGQSLANLPQNGQSAVAGIKNAYGVHEKEVVREQSTENRVQLLAE